MVRGGVQWGCRGWFTYLVCLGTFGGEGGCSGEDRRGGCRGAGLEWRMED